jgi:tetratricopeptide (TPR) repeat protein
VSEPAIHIEGTVGGDVVGGDKIVIQRAGGDIVGGDKITQTAPAIGVAALHQLPSPPADFTGREQELAELREAVRQQGAAISGLRGLGGIGKTALALVLAHALAAEYPDAQIFLNLQGVTRPLEPHAVMVHVLRAYRPVETLPDDPAQLAAAYRSVLNGQRALLLFDNAADRAQLEPLIPPPGCLLLVTSRQKFALPGLKAVNLDSLAPADAAALLLKIASRIGDQAAVLAGLCGYLPLALTLAGSALAEREDLEPAAYVERLRARQGRLGVLKEVEASLALSYDLLTPKLQRFWRMLAVFPAEFDAAAAAAVWAPDLLPAQDRLSDLLHYSLLEYNQESKRYRLHDLAREFALRRQTKAERRVAERQHAQYFSDLLTAASELVKSGNDHVYDGLALFDRERENIFAGQGWAAAQADVEEAAAWLTSEYPNGGLYVLDLRLPPQDRVVWLETALAAVRGLKDRQAEAAHLGSLGNAFYRLNQPGRAIDCYQQQLMLCRELGDSLGEGNALGNLASAYRRMGEPRRAIEYYRQDLAFRRERHDHRGEGNVLGNLGMAYADLRQPGEAVEHYQQALAVFRKIGDLQAESAILGSLGLAYSALGQPARAIEPLEQAVAIHHRLGDRPGERDGLDRLAQALLDVGQTLRAIECYQQCLGIALGLDDRPGQAAATNNLGLAYAQAGELRQAIAYYERALPLFREADHRAGQAAVLHNLGLAYAALGKPARAIEYGEQALPILQDLGNSAGIAETNRRLAQSYEQLGEHQRAAELRAHLAGENSPPS